MKKLIKAFAKIKYKATVVEPKKETEKEVKTKKD